MSLDALHTRRRMQRKRYHRTRFSPLLLVPLLVACGSDPSGPTGGEEETTATYRVTFEATWSAATHPTDFPGNPHFSGLVGGTHAPNVSFWTLGGTATPGMRVMAETGGKTPLEGEVESAVSAGTAYRVISGGGINPSPGAVSLDFTAHPDYPLVTLVSMIAPSPDWFVGVRDLSLREGGAWKDQITVELFAYDAGTDSGTRYTAPNQSTQPQGVIRRLESSPFDNGTPLGTFTFRLIS